MGVTLGMVCTAVGTVTVVGFEGDIEGLVTIGLDAALAVKLMDPLGDVSRRGFTGCCTSTGVIVAFVKPAKQKQNP